MSIVKLIHKALSDSDIRKILGHDTKIIKYSELSQFTDLDQLLPNPVDYCIILYEDDIDRGHWVGLSKYEGKYEHFDSYGLKPDKEVAWINMKKRRLLQEDEPYLSNLLKHEHVIHNTVRYQELDSGVNTCGLPFEEAENGSRRISQLHAVSQGRLQHELRYDRV